jgi:hypothetical protein
MGTLTESDDLLFSTYDHFNAQDREVMQKEYPSDDPVLWIETELSASVQNRLRWYDEYDPLRLCDDDRGPIFSDTIPYDDEGASINVATYINLWLLNILRRSSRELWRFRSIGSSELLNSFQLNKEQIKDAVLEWWLKDGSVANFAVAALSPGSFNLGDHVQPQNRAKSSPRLPKLHKPVPQSPINAKLLSSPPPKTHGLQSTLEVWFTK